PYGRRAAAIPPASRAGADLLVSEAPVEARCLVGQGIELHLPAAPPRGFPLSCLEQPRPEPLAPKVLANPERLHEAGPGPGPAMEARHDVPGCVPDEDGQPAPVIAAGHRRAVTAEVFAERSHVFQARLRLDPEILVHDCLPGQDLGDAAAPVRVRPGRAPARTPGPTPPGRGSGR